MLEVAPSSPDPNESCVQQHRADSPSKSRAIAVSPDRVLGQLADCVSQRRDLGAASTCTCTSVERDDSIKAV